MSMNGKGESPVLKCGAGRVKQEFASRADIKDIVRRYKKTGVIDVMNSVRPIFADVTSIGDFREVMNRVVAAKEAFMRFPARVRSRFDNDPAKLVEFLGDVKNREEAIALGLIPKAEGKPDGAAPLDASVPPAAPK